jgi:hypothetical protein
VHGNYLWYLSHVPVEWWLVTLPGNPPGYVGRSASFPWGPTVHEVPRDRIREMEFDGVLYQSALHWEEDRQRWLSPRQRALPAIYLEHDPPQQHPTDTRHRAADGVDLLVHVTAFNALMWDNGGVPVRVIEHTAVVPESVRYSGELARALTVVNHLERRGRRLGADVYERAQAALPLDLVGMDADSMPGGLGEVPNLHLPAFMARYRLLFHPIRWTSLGLSVVEAMTVGMPVVGLATTEMSTVIRNGRNGWIATDPNELIEVMQALLRNRSLAREWGNEARRTAAKRFAPARFIAEWNSALQQVMRAPARVAVAGAAA